MVVNLLLRSVIIRLHQERSSSNDLRGTLEMNGIRGSDRGSEAAAL
jgi:hypothetical protein